MATNLRVILFPFIVVFYEITIFLSNDMYLPSMPAIAQDLLLTENQVKSTLTAWFLGASSIQFILGPVSDSYGRKKVLVAGAVVFIISSYVCAITHVLETMLLARFFQGLALCALVAANAAIHELYSTKRAIKIMALMGAISILAPSFGPLIGALLVQFASWRYIFWLFVGMGIIAFITTLFFLPETNKAPHPLHFGRIVRDYTKILTNKNFMLPNLAYSLIVAIYYFWMFESPFFMIGEYHKSTLYYGIAQTAIFSCFFVGAGVTKIWLQVNSVISLIKFANIISVLSTIALFIITLVYPAMPLIVICMMIIAFGTSMLFGPINRVSIEASTQPMGRRTAVFSTIISLFGVFSGSILSYINNGTVVTIAALMLASMLLASLMILTIKNNAFLAAEDEQ